MNHVLEARNLRFGYGDRTILPNISLRLEKPEIISIIGPNGSGKSTLLKALSRLLAPTQGVVLLNGKDIHHMKPNDVARIMAVLPQTVQAPPEMTVQDLVYCGRTPYKSLFNSFSSEDHSRTELVIKATGLTDMVHRRLDTLSGGERQRAWLAMALAQEPEILMLDEPTTYLDIHHQLELMKLISRLHQEMRLTVIMVLHDLNHAARFSERIIALKNGRIFADGSAATVFTPNNLRTLYGVETTVMTVKQGGCEHLVCFPHDLCMSCGV